MANSHACSARPFRNVNGDDNNGIIAVGIHEDLLTQPSRIGSLRGTSRTSVQEYANTDESLGEIAKELGVEHLLEGSVQSSGRRVRFSVRLVEAATDRTLWTEQFDEEVTPDNLLDIQTEISRTVVDELQAQLTPEEDAALAAMQPARSSVAQQWYYRGLPAAGGTLAQLRDGIRRVLEWHDHVLDPGFASMLVAGYGVLGEIDAGFAVLNAAVERPSGDAGMGVRGVSFHAMSLRLSLG